MALRPTATADLAGTLEPVRVQVRAPVPASRWRRTAVIGPPCFSFVYGAFGVIRVPL